MKNCGQKFFLFSHKPNGVYEKKLTQTLSKCSAVNSLLPSKSKDSGDSVYLVSLNRNLSSVFLLIRLVSSSIIKIRQGIKIVESIDSAFFPMAMEDRIILIFGTPIHIEMQWLHYPKIVVKYMKFAQDMLIKKAQLVIALNEMMHDYCEKVGAHKSIVCPNYPLRKFRPRMSKKAWFAMNNIPSNSRIALFMAGGRMLEVYGVELLLKAWAIVERELTDSYLAILGPAPDSWIKRFVKKHEIKHLLVLGSVDYNLVPNWINAADVCLASRTPGFETQFYNDKDSTKINEYATMSKPIVACGYSPSMRYLLVRQTPAEFAKGILDAFAGQVKPSIPHYWEENEPLIFKAIEEIF